MAEPKTFHIWLPNSRSLCDRRARPSTSEDREPDKSEDLDAPGCGACILLANHVRAYALDLINRATIWPQTLEKSVDSLVETTWQSILDLDQLRSNMSGHDWGDVAREAVRSPEDPQETYYGPPRGNV